MPWHVTIPGDSYDAARDQFEWDIPKSYNLAYDLVRKHADPGQIALYQAYPDGRREAYTFHELDRLSNQLANGLADLGVERGDRVAVLVPQKPANLLTHLACWKLGAISLPLSKLFGPDAVGYRLRDSEATVVVGDESVTDVVRAVRDECPDLQHVVEVDGGDGSVETSFQEVLAGQPDTFDIVETNADTPAIIIYTSGSTGPPKGALHGHGVWVGHCPAFRMYFEHDVQDAVCWTPADWAWIGALGDLVFPAWHYGRPVVGYPMGKFDSATAFSLMEEFGVTDTFLPPTAIRMLMDVESPTEKYDLSLHAICSGGEPLTPEILDWAADELDGVAVNELYGQTEANLLVTNCRQWFDALPGSMGKPVPGHDVAIVDPETGEECAVGDVGEIAVRREGNPVLFKEYWNDPEKTAASRVGPWHLTGDLATRDDEGYIWFKSRDDDLITTSGYRVGPGEVESAILEHPDVEQVGVVGVPDERRGEVIKAFVQVKSDVEKREALEVEIQNLVKENLAKYEYPREIEFVETLPQTTTGKIQRKELRERELAN
ncbi:MULTISPECIES: acyl-CoA synthetase [unclassified Haladaptatus]|uniref:acyl-CoA synthetase n=1 Tax=unclassified Haladaptatus TaxID=2622732 RepID=UPI0023E79EA6|nr:MULTISPECIES: AMP-binding protein [unclassified Haladaptatus]